MESRITKLVIMFLILIGILGCKKNNGQSYENMMPMGNMEVDTFIEAFGKVTPELVKNVNLTFPAEIEKIHVKKGERVKKGDTLITFSLTDIHKAIRTKEHELLEADIELRKIALQHYNPESGMSKAKVKHKENIRLDLDDLKRQIERPIISDNTIICDFENGIITDIRYKEGDFISLETSVLTIIDADSIIVEADVPEEFIKDIKVGNKTTIIPVADPAVSYEGEVSRISNVATEANGETIITVDVKISQANHLLLPNYNVDVRFYN